MHFLLTASLAIVGLAASASAEWLQFRGPDQGRSNTAGLPLTWSEKENVKWKTPVPGQGWSSPVSDGKQVWLSTATEDGRSLRAIRVDFESGKITLDVEVFRQEVAPPKHARNSYASPTPILDGDRVYLDFGSWGIACLSTKDGQKLWENRELKVDHQNGPGGCSVLHGDRLLVACDGIDLQYGAALDKHTGKLLWKTERSAAAKLTKRPGDLRKAYGTPVVFQIDGRAQAITCGAERLYSHDPATGEELWFVDYPGFSNAPVPVFDGEQIYVCTGFNKPELWAIKASGLKGNVSTTHVSWKQKSGVPDQASPVVVGKRLYMVSSGGIASSINTADGSIVWKERLGADFAASPIAADGRLYFFPTGAGPAKVVAASDTFQVLAQNTLSEGCMATPAVVGKALLVRTKAALYRLEQ
jgi:outer membrane protein assembly factor BamB